jgi:hypothetical protein
MTLKIETASDGKTVTLRLSSGGTVRDS